jgi:serine/threonine protein kinase
VELHSSMTKVGSTGMSSRQTVAHLLLKIANWILVLFSKESGSWKIADFGFTAECSSKFRDQSSKEGRGTDGYRAPELRNKFPRYSAMTDVWSLGCVLYELAVGKQAFADDWAIGEYVQSNELKLPFEDLKNWSDNSMTTLKMIIQNTLAVDDFMRPAAEHFSNMMCNMIKREADQGHGLQEVRVFRCTCGGNLTSEHLFPQVIVGDRINVATADASSFDAEADPSDDSPPHDEGMDDDPMEIGDGEVERSKRLKLSRRRIGLKRTVNVNGYGIEKVRHTKTVVCVTCGEKFTRKSDLTRHDESVHQDERIYSCPHCPLHRAFARKDALKVCHHSFSGPHS